MNRSIKRWAVKEISRRENNLINIRSKNKEIIWAENKFIKNQYRNTEIN
jgi:hypothetical protein